MGKGDRLRRIKHPQKIRVRSDEEIRETIAAYKNIYKDDPFLANLMLLCSELSEYVEIHLNDEEKLREFVKRNKDDLIKIYLRRFKWFDEYALPLEPVDSWNLVGPVSNLRH